MSSDLVIGGSVALVAYLLMCGLVWYNRRVVENIYRKNITHIREIKSEIGSSAQKP